MSHTFRSKDHTACATGDEISYSFVHDQGLTSGGYVDILVFNESKFVQSTHDMKLPARIGELKVHKDALVAFVAAMVRDAKAEQIEELNDMGAFGL